MVLYEDIFTVIRSYDISISPEDSFFSRDVTRLEWVMRSAANKQHVTCDPFWWQPVLCALHRNFSKERLIIPTAIAKLF